MVESETKTQRERERERDREKVHSFPNLMGLMSPTMHYSSDYKTLRKIFTRLRRKLLKTYSVNHPMHTSFTMSQPYESNFTVSGIVRESSVVATNRTATF